MSLIPKAPAAPDREAVPVRLDRALLAQLQEYAEFVHGGRDYVIAGALQRLFKCDREFIAWRQKRDTAQGGTAATDAASPVTEMPASESTAADGDQAKTTNKGQRPSRERA
jgi:predicted transcriptional regulator